MEYFRIVDANINRASEGLRILEEIYRFLYNDSNISAKLKEIRHKVRFSIQEYPLIKFRESNTDVGKNSFSNLEKNRESIEKIFLANIKRVEESLRVLEEFFKLGNHEKSFLFKKLRFEIYGIEQEIYSLKRFFNTILSTNEILLYGIMDSRFTGIDYEKLCCELIEAGIKIIQLRDKVLTDKFLLQTAKKLSEICKEKEVLFIVNDRADVAYLADADGVHLGQDDISIDNAKKIFGFNKIYGLSTHNLKQVEEASKKDVDYIGFGPVYPTKSKENPDPVVGTDNLKLISSKYNIPVVAIGGINHNNIGDVVKCNPKMICVMSGIISRKNVKNEVLKFRREINDTIRICKK